MVATFIMQIINPTTHVICRSHDDCLWSCGTNEEYQGEGLRQSQRDDHLNITIHVNKTINFINFSSIVEPRNPMIGYAS